MKNKYAVMETKTKIILVKGSMKYCQEWIFKNCKYIKKYDIWKDSAREAVTIITI